MKTKLQISLFLLNIIRSNINKEFRSINVKILLKEVEFYLQLRGKSLLRNDITHVLNRWLSVGLVSLNITPYQVAFKFVSTE